MIEKISGDQRVSNGAIRRRLKKRQRVLLVDHAHIEVNNPGAGDIHAYALHGEPEEELLSRDAGEIADVGMGEVKGDVEVIVELVLELGDARVRQGYLEDGSGG